MSVQLGKSRGKSDGSKVSSLETSAWQRRSTMRLNSGVECKSRGSNLICLATVERGKSCDTISFVKLIRSLHEDQPSLTLEHILLKVNRRLRKRWGTRSDLAFTNFLSWFFAHLNH